MRININNGQLKKQTHTEPRTSDLILEAMDWYRDSSLSLSVSPFDTTADNVPSNTQDYRADSLQSSEEVASIFLLIHPE